MKCPKTDPGRAVAYLRASTEDQQLGPEAQRAAIEGWAKRECVQICAWRLDAGISGASELADRTGLMAALVDLKTHHAGLLIVARRDRLARDVMAAAMIERLATDAGARIVSVAGEGTSTDDPTSILLRRVVDAFAEYERALIRTRTAAALAAKRARGEVSNHAPWGYRAIDGRLVKNDYEQTILVHVRSARSRGLTVRAIARELIQAGAISRRGRPLTVSAVGELVAKLEGQ
jgi:DNA invertase Pin-like site-specific DNA recombinase